MMTSSNGNIFRVTGPLCGEFTGHRRIPRTSFDVFFDLRPNKPLNKQSRGWWFETPSRSLWRHCNGTKMSLLYAGHRLKQCYHRIIVTQDIQRSEINYISLTDYFGGHWD